jgi:hypothetical protein
VDVCDKAMRSLEKVWVSLRGFWVEPNAYAAHAHQGYSRARTHVNENWRWSHRHAGRNRPLADRNRSGTVRSPLLRKQPQRIPAQVCQFGHPHRGGTELSAGTKL